MKRMLLSFCIPAGCTPSSTRVSPAGLVFPPLLCNLFGIVKKKGFFSVLLVLVFHGLEAQVPVTFYDFDNNTTRTTGELTVEQEVNAGGSLPVFKAGSVSSAISFNNGAGSFNGGTATGRCISATDWTTGTTNPGTGAAKYLQFTTSVSGFSGIKVAFEGVVSSGSSTRMGVLYSTDGINFAASSTTPISLSNSWGALVYFDVPANADNAASLTIRLYAYGVSSSSVRVDVDNIVVLANAQVSGVKTLLDYPLMGASLRAGTNLPFLYPWTNFTVSGTGTECVLRGNMNISGTLTVNSGATLDCGPSVIGGGTGYGLGAGTFVLNAGGKLQIGHASGISASGSTGNIQLGTRTYNAAAMYEYTGTGNQVIGNGFPNNLTGSLVIANNGTVNKTVTLDVTRTIAAGGNLILQAGIFAAGNNLTLANGSTLNRADGFITGTPSNNASIVYTGNTKSAGIELGTSLSNLQIALNHDQTVTLAGNCTVTGSFTLTSGSLSVGSASFTIAGSLTRSGGSVHALAGTVVLSGSNPQVIPDGLFSGVVNHLVLNNNAGVSTADLAVTNLTLTLGTLSVGTSTLTVNGSISRTGGLINASAGTMVFGGNSAQTIAANTFTGDLNHLTIDNAQGVATSGNISLGGNLALTAGTFSIGNTTLSVKGSISRTGGNISAPAGTVVLNSTSPQTIGSESFSTAINNLIVNSTANLTTDANLTVSNTLTLTSGTLNLGTATLALNGTISRTSGSVYASSGTVVFGGSTAQVVPANTFTGALNNVEVDNTAGVSNPVDQTINGTLTLNAGLYSPGATTLTLKGNVARVAGSINASQAHVVFNGTAGQIIDADAFAGPIANLTVNNTAGVNTSSDATITGTLTLTAGTYNIGTSVHTITGGISRTGGIINAASGTLVFNGSTAQVIPAGSLSAAVRNLTVNNTAGLTINANHTVSSALILQAGPLVLNDRTLTLSGTVSGNGVFRGSAASGLTITSPAVAGTLNFDQTTDGSTNALGSLTVTSGTATLGNKLTLYTVLQVTGGTLDLAAKNMVLKSVPSNTARVAPVYGTINGATNVTVERWLPNNGRRYRLITAGVTTTTSIRANWMEGALNTSFCATCNVNPKPGYGTHITGAGGNANGFDVTATNNASLFTYNLSTGGWTGISSTNGTLSATTPYLIFLRGDRSVDMTASGNIPVLLPGSGTTLRATGTLPVGTRTTTVLAPAGKTTLISNPYPSPVSWTSIYANNSTGFENYYNYFEPKVGQRGAYVTVTNYGLNNNVNSAATEQIQSGQAFFVTTKTGAVPASFVIREQDKSGTANLNVFRVPLNHIQKFYISLNFTESNGQKFNADGVLSAFGTQFSNDVDSDDAIQIASWDEDIALLRDGKLLSIETRNALSENDTLYLSTSRLKTGQNYEWQFTPKDMATPVYEGYLVDNYLKKRTAISLTDTTFQSFTVTSDAASAAANRFFIVFRPELSTLPVSFTSVKAYQQAGSQKIQVEWQTVNESALHAYEVEKSANGREFAKIGVVKPENNAGNTYSFLDVNPFSSNYYRIRSLSGNGAVKYSRVVLVKTGSSGEKFSIYPNPVQGGLVSLRFENLPKGSYSLQLHNSAGSLVFSSRITWNGGNGTQAVPLSETLAAGAYQASLFGNGVKGSVLLVKE